jgi:hypothetical protein
MTLARALMAESGLTGRFWFRALSSSTDARNATYHERTKITPFRAIHGRKWNLSKFRALGCRANLYLKKERRPAGKHLPRAWEGIHLGFATDSNTSGYVHDLHTFSQEDIPLESSEIRRSPIPVP